MSDNIVMISKKTKKRLNLNKMLNNFEVIHVINIDCITGNPDSNQ